MSYDMDSNVQTQSFIEEKRMWQIHGAAVGTIPVAEVLPMTPIEKDFFDKVRAQRKADKAAGLSGVYEMPTSDGSSF